MRVELDELLKAVDAIASYLRSIDQTSVEVADDYYWDVPRSERYDVSKKPELSIGQLSDDLAEIRSILKAGDATGLDLIHAAALLRAFGERSRG